MSTIKRVEFTNRKPHLRYDSASKKYIGYQIDVRAGKKRHRNTFATRGEAERFIDELRKKLVYSKAGVKTEVRSAVNIRQLFAKRLEKITNRKELIRATRVFASFGDVFGYPPNVSDIRKAHFQTYINVRLETGVKPETVNREVTILSTAFKQAASLFPVDLEDYEPPQIIRPRFKKGKRNKRVITETEKDLIVDSILKNRLPNEHLTRTRSRPAVAAMFELAWLLGLRFAEVKNLLKTDFKPNDRSLRVVRWKTGDVDILEFLPDRVIEIFQKAESPTEYIFDLPCSDHTFADLIKEGCEANGIKYGRAEIDGVTFHSTRHSFTSRIIQVTDMATAAAFTGHSSKEMVDYYSHASTESKKQAMEKLYGGKKVKADLRDIYDKVVAGALDFEAFKKALE